MWYAGNFIVPTNAQMIGETGQEAFPMRCIAHNRAGGRIFGGPLDKTTQIKKSSEVAMIYDGLRCHSYNTNLISARHGRRQTQTNFLFADGHALSVDSASLPKGTTVTDSDLRSAITLVNSPFPKWRLDQ